MNQTLRYSQQTDEHYEHNLLTNQLQECLISANQMAAY